MRRIVPVLLTSALLLSACEPAPPPAAEVATPLSKPRQCDAHKHGRALVAERGVWLGVNLDWGKDTPAAYAARVGHRPAVVVSFAPAPIDAQHSVYLDDAAKMLAASGGMLLLTLEPQQGLATITPELAASVAKRLAGYNAQGVPVLLRFAHEMNGSWYAWGQQPRDYVAAFRRMADAVHRLAPGTAMAWAPNYGGGYPFAGGRYWARAGSAQAKALDTNGDGKLTGADDPYAPYYPGDDAVDWVGMSLYHWGDAYPWGSNDLPEPRKFEAMLTGDYQGTVGDQRLLPDFYRVYGEQRGKPVGIFETAAFYAPGAGGADELVLKSAWWRQVFAADLPQRYPLLKMINWFEWDKYEAEIKGRVDWGVSINPEIRAAYQADLPSWARFADDVDFCGELSG